MCSNGWLVFCSFLQQQQQQQQQQHQPGSHYSLCLFPMLAAKEKPSIKLLLLRSSLGRGNLEAEQWWGQNWSKQEKLFWVSHFLNLNIKRAVSKWEALKGPNGNSVWKSKKGMGGVELHLSSLRVPREGGRQKRVNTNYHIFRLFRETKMGIRFGWSESINRP